jgi:peptidoglycan biosynthesis protein MviN/MurJ (putative lipid II flippase)
MQIVLSLVLVRYVGPIGAVIAMVVSMSLDRVFNVRRICSVLDASGERGRVFRGLAWIGLAAAAAGVVTAAILMLLPGLATILRLMAAGICFSITYVTILVGTGIIDRDEREAVSHRIQGMLRTFRQRVSPRPV